MSEKKYDCQLVQDLLPLYHDGVCSESSKMIVEEHLKECANCRKVEENLSDYGLDEKLAKERNDVLVVHEKKERKKTYTVGIITACILMVPVLICLICNLAIGHALDWFFIVLASMILVGSLTVVPMVVQEKKVMWTMCASTGALLLLLMVCCIYSGGNWFFVAATGSVLGISLFCFPYIICKASLPQSLENKKALLTMAWDTFWLYLLIIVCGICLDTSISYWGIALSTTTLCVLTAWAIFGVVRYLPCNATGKTGLIFLITGVVELFGNDVISAICHVPCEQSIFKADLSKGFGAGSMDVLSANISLTTFLVLAAIGVVLLITGLVRGKNN